MESGACRWWVMVASRSIGTRIQWRDMLYHYQVSSIRYQVSSIKYYQVTPQYTVILYTTQFDRRVARHNLDLRCQFMLSVSIFNSLITHPYQCYQCLGVLITNLQMKSKSKSTINKYEGKGGGGSGIQKGRPRLCEDSEFAKAIS